MLAKLLVVCAVRAARWRLSEGDTHNETERERASESEREQWCTQWERAVVWAVSVRYARRFVRGALKSRERSCKIFSCASRVACHKVNW